MLSPRMPWFNTCLTGCLVIKLQSGAADTRENLLAKRIYYRWWCSLVKISHGVYPEHLAEGFEMTGKLNVSFRAHREKSFSSLKDAIFELKHCPITIFPLT